MLSGACGPLRWQDDVLTAGREQAGSRGRVQTRAARGGRQENEGNSRSEGQKVSPPAGRRWSRAA
eukprot:3931880-Rhodomonas_salina.3